MSKKKVISSIIAAILLLCMVIFICLPLQTAKLHIKVYFEKTAGSRCNVYYETTDSKGFSEDKTVYADIKDGVADIILDASLAKTLCGLRFDFPADEDKAVVTRVEITSGGFIQKSYDGIDFFAPASALIVNGITALDPLELRKAVVVTTADPYMVFGAERIEEITDSFSHYTVTKAVACLFLATAFVCAGKKLFSE